MTIEKKIDQLIDSVNTLTTAIKDINEKLDKFEARIEKLEKKIDKTHDELADKITEKASVETVQESLERIARLEKELNKSREKSFKDDLTKEAYSKRLNLLIHGLTENFSHLWETRDETLKIFNSFLVNGLKIIDPSSIHVIDIHRLPQHPVYKNGTKHTRPILVKLNSVFDKRAIFSSIKNLQTYNTTLSCQDDSPIQSRRVYITEHLPVAFIDQRNRLLPTFKKAKLLKKNTSWRFVGGDYCLFINGVKITELDDVEEK